MSLDRVSFRQGRAQLPRLTPPYVPGRHSERFWSEDEKEVVRAHYAAKGPGYCAALLPRRTAAQVSAKASALGVKRNGQPSERRRHPVDPELDARIRDGWPGLEGRGAVARFAEQLQIPRWVLSKRLAALGLALPHKKEPPWSAAETKLLDRVPLHNLDAAVRIFRDHGFVRSATAIMVKVKRLGLSRRYRETLSARQAAEILGVDDKTATVWCIEGLIEATRRESLRLPQQGGAPWSITPAALRRFVVDHPERIDLRKVDKFAFIALLAGASPEQTTGYRAVIDADPDSGEKLFGLWPDDPDADLIFCVKLRKLQRFVEKETGEDIDLFAGIAGGGGR